LGEEEGDFGDMQDIPETHPENASIQNLFDKFNDVNTEPDDDMERIFDRDVDDDEVICEKEAKVDEDDSVEDGIPAQDSFSDSDNDEDEEAKESSKNGDLIGDSVEGEIIEQHWNFQAVGAVITGATHIRNGLPCQDSLFISSANAKYAVACVADGHGSKSSPYSDEGAKDATRIASEIIVASLDNLTAHKDIWLPKQIEAEWKKAIIERHEKAERDLANPFPYIQYGTTLIALAVLEGLAFALQIGDGNILMVDKSGVVHPILATNEVGEDTESLCLDNAWKHMRTRIVPIDISDAPCMFLISTDGYDKSFVDDAGFLKVGTDYFNRWQENGISSVGDELEGLLRQTSGMGSGDDIALALVVVEKKK